MSVYFLLQISSLISLYKATTLSSSFPRLPHYTLPVITFLIFIHTSTTVKMSVFQTSSFFPYLILVMSHNILLLPSATLITHLASHVCPSVHAYYSTVCLNFLVVIWSPLNSDQRPPLVSPESIHIPQPLLNTLLTST